MRSLAPALAASWRQARWLCNVGREVRTRCRVIGTGLAALVLLGVVVIGGQEPVGAQGSEAAAIGLWLSDLSGFPTHTTVDGFTVELSNLTATEDYKVTVLSDSAGLGIGGCGTPSQTETVTGVEAHDLKFLVYACAVGEATVTAEVRLRNANRPVASISQRVVVEALPEEVITASGERLRTATLRTATRSGTPGIVPSISFYDVEDTSFKVRWGTPSDGGRPLTGFGLLIWIAPHHPPYSSAHVVGPSVRSHHFVDMDPDTTYSFRIHACNGQDSCGFWTDPPKTVTTKSDDSTEPQPPQPPQPPTPPPIEGARPPSKVRSLDHTGSGQNSVTLGWDAPEVSGSAELTGFHVQHKDVGTSAWPQGSDVVTPGTVRTWTIGGLTNGTPYNVRIQACNGDSECGDWTVLGEETINDLSDDSAIAGHKVGNARIEVAKTTIDIGERLQVTVYDIPIGEVAYMNLYGSIQPERQCPTRSRDVVPRRFGQPSTGGWYDSFRIDGCPDGGKGYIRVTNQDESKLYASVTITVRGRPTPVGNLTARSENGQLRITWEAPADSGGTALRDYKLQYKQQSSTTWGSAITVHLATDPEYIIFGLSNGTAYDVRVQACNQDNRCSAWEDTSGTPSDGSVTEPEMIDETVEGDLETISSGAGTATSLCGLRVETAWGPPQHLDIFPLPERKALLCWSPVMTASIYMIQSAQVATSGTSAPLSWDNVAAVTLPFPPPPGAKLPNWLELDLDDLAGLASPTKEGIGQRPGFHIRVRAIKGTAVRDSKGIIIIDSPITIADASSSSGNGKAKLAWNPIDHATVLNDSGAAAYTGGTYSFRYRQSATDHRQPDWQPGDYKTVQTINRDEMKEPDTITGLVIRSLYAIQLRYTDDDPANPEVLSARDVYVWPSDEPADHLNISTGDSQHSRIAGMPLDYRITERTANGDPELVYRICGETFDPEGLTRKNQWLTLINNAFRSWQAAFPSDLLTITYSTDACADYGPLITKIFEDLGAEVRAAIAAGKPLTDEAKRKHVDGTIRQIRTNRAIEFGDDRDTPYVVQDVIDEDLSLNEILLYDDSPGSELSYLAHHGIFTGLSTHLFSGIPRIAVDDMFFSTFSNILGHDHNCWFDHAGMPNGALMCTLISRYDDDESGRTVVTSDIFIRRSKFVGTTLAVPMSDARANWCLNDGDKLNTAYRSLLHEIGHALGHGVEAEAGVSVGQGDRHPAGSDSVMNYSGGEPDCSPYPLDVLGIYALYQSR